ncbi:MAG: hypothetical protein ACP5TE_07425 [Verrucomicrobiia bacterium]|jgi:ribosomal protein L7/L12
MHRLSARDRKTIEMALRAGNKMQAIRLYMIAVPGSTMKEAKEEVESILTGIYVEEIGARGHIPEETNHGNPFTSKDSIMGGIPYIDRLQIAEELFEGNKHEAIKIYKRLLPEVDDKKAKKIIELYQDELYAAFPKRFIRPISKSVAIKPIYLALIAVVVITLIITAIYIFMLW